MTKHMYLKYILSECTTKLLFSILKQNIKTKHNKSMLPRKLGNNTCFTTDHKLISCFFEKKNIIVYNKDPQPFQITLISLIGQSWLVGRL